MTIKKDGQEASDREANLAEVPADSTAGFLVVGVGASAGGLPAFKAFFAGIQPDVAPGMAFVLVQHRSPDHESLLGELVQRYTALRVMEAEDGVPLRANCVYVAPPNRDIAVVDGTVRLSEPGEPRRHRLPIDFFFRSLARDQHQHAVGIVLSGTGSDGSVGARAIREAGGLVIAQSVSSSEYDGMPASAIASGAVDFVLAPAEMPAHLMAYARRTVGDSPVAATVKSETALQRLFAELRTQTGHDFSQYKPSTILRRIDRRMAVHQLDSLEEYVRYLHHTPAEGVALLQELLIGVTRFFRDPDTFAALEEGVIPQLFDHKPAGSAIRVWSVGCSTGEEAYSLAILFQERLESLRSNYKLQVFATDLDARAIAVARAGYYPASISNEMTPERLSRYFVESPENGGYRIHKSIRDLLVFSEHDLIRDPPFSKIDLISCRNLLIYLGAELQKRIIPMFHCALNRGGTLVLGPSESVGEFTDLFAAHGRKSRLYRRRDVERGPRQPTHSGFPARLVASAPGVNHRPHEASPPARLTPRALTEQALLRHTELFGALVNAQGDIVYLHGRGGMFLEPTAGDAGTNNILGMAREGLRSGLALALRKAVASRTIERSFSPRVKTNGHYVGVNLTVCPVGTDPLAPHDPPRFLVVLQEVSPAAGDEPTPSGRPVGVGGADVRTEADAQVVSMGRELLAKHDALESANEELEVSNEELQSANEELQSINEELQSSNEELETSKEELQSINEELITVNAELQAKVADLSRASSDMNNLLASTGVGTVFVDHHLRILRFTPAATRIINLIPSDLGRPVSHLASNLLNYDSLVADTTAVLDTLVPKAIDVHTRDGCWYNMRILPYRTVDNVIEGAVITFLDISETVRARDALAMANKALRLAVVVRDAHDAITVQDLDGRIIAWNPGAERMYGWTEEEALRMNVRERIPAGLQASALLKVHRLSQDNVLQRYRTQRLTRAGTVVDVWITATALEDPPGVIYAIATTERLTNGRSARGFNAKRH